jgi:hypothetical protein
MKDRFFRSIILKRAIFFILALCVISIIMVATIVGYSVLVGRVIPIVPISTDISHAKPTFPPLPEHLLLVKPTGALNIAAYNRSKESDQLDSRGIVVGIYIESRNLNVLMSGMAIYIDGIKISNLLMSVEDGLMPYGPFVFHWEPNLLPGLHEAKFQLTKDSREVIEYTWRFIITEK